MKPAETYILNRNEPYRSILLHLKAIIEHTLPDAQLLYKWKVPYFYVGKRPICYLNHSKDYVNVGFWNSAHLTVHTELMTTDGRKVVKSLRYKSLEEVDDTILIDVVKEAYALRDKKFFNTQ